MDEVIEKAEELAMLFVQMQEKYVELLNAIKLFRKGETGELIVDENGCRVDCPARKLYPECYHSHCEDPTDNMTAEEIQQAMDKCESCGTPCPYKPWSPDTRCNSSEGDELDWDE